MANVGSTNAPRDDLDGIPRPLGPKPALGAYEMVPYPQSIIQSAASVISSWNVISGAVYRLQWCDELRVAGWTNAGPQVTASNLALAFADTNALSARRYYRLAALPP